MNQFLGEKSPRRYILQVFAPGVFLSLLALILTVYSLSSGEQLWDDAYMFARYARNLCEGHGVSWNPPFGPAYGLTSVGYLVFTLPFFSIFDTVAAALWWASASAGVLFAALLIFSAGFSAGENKIDRWLAAFFTALVLAAAAPELAVHFASGMDTTFALSWLTGCIALLLWCDKDDSPRVLIIAAVAIGLLFAIRPDALLLGFPALLLFQRSGRALLRAALAASVVIGIQLLAGKLYFGQWLPNPFYVKSSALYDAAFYAFFEGASLHYTLLFLGAIPWVLLCLLLQLFAAKRGFDSRQRALLLPCLLFFGYQLAFVTPIMGEHARFLFPSLPFLCLAAARSIVVLRETIAQRISAETRTRIFRWPFLYLVCALGLIFVKPQALHEAVGSVTRQKYSVWTLPEIYQARFTKSWAALDKVAALPNDLVIASTEVGLLGAMNQEKRIIDLTGLHDSKYLRSFSPSVLWQDLPDLIYMPFPHYVGMIRALESDPFFIQEYAYYGAGALDTRFGVAIRKKSKHYETLAVTFDRDI